MKRGYIDMVGDLFHAGHVDLIKCVHDLGYNVIVGVHSDGDVERYKRKPILTMEERISTIKMCKFVSSVLPSAPLLIDEQFIIDNDIDMVFHSHEEDEEYYNQMYSVPIKLGKFTRTNRRAGISTTSIIDRVVCATKDRRHMRIDSLKDKLRSQTRTLRIMETHSGISGMIAENAQQHGKTFDGMWSSSLTASLLKGRPDIEVVDTTARLQVVRDTLNSTTHLPLIYDGDTGGSKEIFYYTVRDLEDIGVSACIIEDKTGLKQNSLFGTDKVQVLEDIPTFCEKLKTGISARRNSNFMIIARIEALIAGQGQEEAVRRARAYIEAGADAIMIHSKQTTFDEIRDFMTTYNTFEYRVPVIAVPSTYDTVTEDTLWNHGINICIYANHAFRASFKAMETISNSILGNGCGYACRPHMTSIKSALTLLDKEPKSNSVLNDLPKPDIDEIAAFIGENHRLVIGVPDSTLRSLCDRLMSDSTIHSHVAVNEGAAVSIASGWSMATGDVPLVYMQNSGLGNAVNPLTSLTHSDVYSIPMVLLIGWRGAPGVKDEPQHTVMGSCTMHMLELMSIPVLIATDRNIINVLKKANASAMKESKPVAVLLKSGVLPPHTTPPKIDISRMASISRNDAIREILDVVQPEDVIVCTTGFSSRDLLRLRMKRGESSDRDFLCVGSMGYALSIAQGVAMAQPHRIVWCIDGDGAQLMHLGTLTGASQFEIPNLKHVTLNNMTHESVGITHTAAKTIDLRRCAFAAGYEFSRRVDALQEVRPTLVTARGLAKSAYVVILTSVGSGNKDLPRPTESPLSRKIKFVEFLKSEPASRKEPPIACSETGDALLLTPGPLTTAARVKHRMLHDIGSRDAAFSTVLKRLEQNILTLVNGTTTTHQCVPIPGSGTYAVESMISLVSGPILLCINGAYGERMLQMCRIHEVQHYVYKLNSTCAFSPQSVSDELSKYKDVQNVAIVHCETTTGVLNPLFDIIPAIRKVRPECRVFVDAMSSIATVPFDIKCIDAVAFSSNKGIEGPPGLAILVASNTLLKTMQDVPSKTLSLDACRHFNHLSSTGQCQFTPPTHVILGLDEALVMLFDEGAETRRLRFSNNCSILRSELLSIGFESVVPCDVQAPVIVTFPLLHHKFADISQSLKEYGYAIYEGKMKNTFRVGCMGMSNDEMRAFTQAFKYVVEKLNTK